MSCDSEEVKFFDSYACVSSEKIRNIPHQGLTAFVKCTEQLKKSIHDQICKNKPNKYIAIDNELYYLCGFQCLSPIDSIEVGDTVAVIIEKTTCDWGWRSVNGDDVVGPFESYIEAVQDAILILGKDQEIEIGKVKSADPADYVIEGCFDDLSEIVDRMERNAERDFGWVRENAAVFKYEITKSNEIFEDFKRMIVSWARKHFTSPYWNLDDVRKVKI
jgi:hypothetical protein